MNSRYEKKQKKNKQERLCSSIYPTANQLKLKLEKKLV